MSNTREDSNSGQRSVARQKAHKGNFRHKANENVDFGDHRFVFLIRRLFLQITLRNILGKKIPKYSAFWGITFTGIDIRVVQSISYIIL